MIEVKGLSKFYHGFAAINDVSFSIGEGEIVGLLGLNGAGKSTILKILGCFLVPSSGRASVCGFDVEENPHEVRKSIGFLPDTPPLYNEMTVRSYLRYVAKIKDVSANRISESVSEALASAGLLDIGDVVIGELSHGYRQRVGIAQAIVHRPRVLIFDEPINGLDPVQIVEMRDLILSLRQKHTVILSSHILSEITRTCDRILIVDGGQLVAVGSEKDLERTSSGLKSLRLAFSKDVGQDVIDFISSLAWIRNVNRQSMTRLGVECDAERVSDLIRDLVKRDLPLVECSPAENHLESLFMKFVKRSVPS